MKRTHFLLLLALIGANLLAGQPKDVTDLKSRYQIALDKATQPITETYKRELMKLLDKYRAANDIDGIAAVTEELTQLGSAILANPTSSAGSAVAEDVDKYFINKSWYSTANAEYHFEKDGSGHRIYTSIKTPFTWRRIDGGIVEVSGRNTLDSPVSMWYFKFDNRKTALFGRSKDSMVDPLRGEK